jgi:Helix-turn-helix domain
MSRATQCEVMLRVLRQSGSAGVTTLQARENHGILSPACRVLELRRTGHDIRTVWAFQLDAEGRPHRVARYVLLKESRK